MDPHARALIAMFVNWLVKHWVTGSAFMAGGFICLAPLMAKLLPLTLLLIYLHTPGYMLNLERHRLPVQMIHFGT